MKNLFFGILAGLGILYLAFLAYSKIYIVDSQKMRLEKDGIPYVLLEHDLSSVQVEGDFENWFWLRKGRDRLTLHGSNMPERGELPKAIRNLVLRRVKGSSLNGLSSLMGLEGLILINPQNQVDRRNPLDASVLGTLQSLRHIELEKCPILIGFTVGSLENLTGLKFDHSDPAILVDINRNKKLTHLEIKGFQVSKLVDLSGLSSLKTLVIDGTSLKRLPGLPLSLETLHVTGNSNLESVGELDALSNLRELKIRDNAIKPTELPGGLQVLMVNLDHRFPPEELELLEQLHTLVLDQNKADLVTFMPHWASLFPRIRTLRLEWFDEPAELTFLSQLPELVDLSVEHSLGIEDFTPIEALDSLHHLKLMVTPLVTLDPPDSLTSFWLEGNDRLSMIHGFPDSLEKLHIINNGTYLPDTKELPSLDELVLASLEQDFSEIGPLLGSVRNWRASYRQTGDSFDPAQAVSLYLFGPTLTVEALKSFNELESLTIERSILEHKLDLGHMEHLHTLYLPDTKGVFPKSLPVGLKGFSFSCPW